MAIGAIFPCALITLNLILWIIVGKKLLTLQVRRNSDGRFPTFAACKSGVAKLIKRSIQITYAVEIGNGADWPIRCVSIVSSRDISGFEIE